MEDIPVQVLEGLADRTVIPRLDLKQLQSQLTRMDCKLHENPELDAIRKHLYEIAESEKTGSEEHRQLVKKYNEQKVRKHSDSTSRSFDQSTMC